MARPREKEARLISFRNQLILQALGARYTQTEVAFMFRLPRNTVNNVAKKTDE